MSHICPPTECYAATLHPGTGAALPRVPDVHTARSLMDDSDVAYLAGNRTLAARLTDLAGEVLDWLDRAVGCPSCRCRCSSCRRRMA